MLNLKTKEKTVMWLHDARTFFMVFVIFGGISFFTKTTLEKFCAGIVLPSLFMFIGMYTGDIYIFGLGSTAGFGWFMVDRFKKNRELRKEEQKQEQEKKRTGANVTINLSGAADRG